MKPPRKPACLIALSGTMDEQIVNIADDRPVTVFEMAELAGNPLEGSNEPLTNPWSGRMDPSLAHELGFRPTVPTIYAAARDAIL
jgi:UDP-glucose 4-epimerase